MSKTFCPATMCPLFAADGSPWTGEINAECPQDNKKCGFWYDGCDGCSGAIEQVEEARRGERLLQIGPVRQKKIDLLPKTFDCQRATECQWQEECKPNLCPPRYALSLGVDPRSCAY